MWAVECTQAGGSYVMVFDDIHDTASFVRYLHKCGVQCKTWTLYNCEEQWP